MFGPTVQHGRFNQPNLLSKVEPICADDPERTDKKSALDRVCNSFNFRSCQPQLARVMCDPERWDRRKSSSKDRACGCGHAKSHTHRRSIRYGPKLQVLIIYKILSAS